VAEPRTGVAERRVVSLPMYDLPEVAAAHAALWRVLRAELARRGVDHDEQLGRAASAEALWTDPGLLLTQACGWPLVTSLTDEVAVVGTFVHRLEPAEAPGWYRSRIVVRAADHARTPTEFTDRRAAVNGRASLSGWISLRTGLLGGLTPWPGEVVVTGSHVASVAAVARGDADVAAIDGVTLTMLQRHRPAALTGLAIVGSGPPIPCLPLVTRADAGADRVAALRSALAATVRHPATRAARAALLLDDFVPVDEAHYRPLRVRAGAAA
jgi:ABC-type phosphate/phosphonate transport system substrate-binding protein